MILGESNAKDQLLLPTLFVDQRRIAQVLARVAVQPALFILRVDLGPDVVTGIVDIARGKGECAAQAGEQVGRFSAATRTCFKQFRGSVETGKAVRAKAG